MTTLPFNLEYSRAVTLNKKCLKMVAYSLCTKVTISGPNTRLSANGVYINLDTYEYVNALSVLLEIFD
jgi:hypothetical protein